MKNLTALLPMIVASLLAVPDSAAAQHYAVIDYMKVDDSKVDDYKSVESNIWKKIHQQRVQDGKILYWGFYAVRNRDASNRDYNFVTVNVYESFAKLEEPDFMETASKVYSGQESESNMAATVAARDLIWSEVWRVENAIFGDGDSSRIVTSVDYQQPAAGKTSDYVEAEMQVFSRLHKARIDAGQMRSWVFLSRRFPGGSKLPYSFLTINTFPNEQAGRAQQPSDDELVNSVVAGFNDRQKELLQTTIPQLRTTVKADLWQRLDYVMAPRPAGEN